jgi:RNA recognition motif-containing protein
MAIKLFVGSLAWATTDESLNHHFAQAGTVASARVVTDRETGRSRGFGFVEMSSDDEARNALATLNNTELDGRTINVSEARPQEERPQRDGGNYRPRGNFNRDHQSGD